MLDTLGGDLSVTVVVGENGAGKSRLLRDIALRERGFRDVYAISNTIYDRFANMRGIRRISSNSGRLLPQRLLKRAIISAANEGIVRLRTVAETLDYCGYMPELGVSIQFTASIQNRLYNDRDTNQLLYDIIALVDDDQVKRNRDTLPIDDLHAVLPLLLDQRYLGPESPLWLYFDDDLLRSSRSEQATKILVWEPYLRAAKIVDRVDLHLKTKEGSRIPLPLNDASSGQLTLIACLAFLSAVATEHSVILIDEPENSLHPRWQREYVERLLQTLAYREPTIIIATHAPIIVAGAQMIIDAKVQVLRLSSSGLEPVERSRLPGEKTSLEETLYESFGTVTPANHFVSESLSREFSKLRAGRTTADEMAVVIEKMREASFDPQQAKFLESAAELARRVEADQKDFGSSDG